MGLEYVIALNILPNACLARGGTELSTSPSPLSPQLIPGSGEAFGRVDNDPKNWYNLIFIAASGVKGSCIAWKEEFQRMDRGFQLYDLCLFAFHFLNFFFFF